MLECGEIIIMFGEITLKEDICNSSTSVSLSQCAGKWNKYIFIESVIEWEDSE